MARACVCVCVCVCVAETEARPLECGPRLAAAEELNVLKKERETGKHSAGMEPNPREDSLIPTPKVWGRGHDHCKSCEFRVFLCAQEPAKLLT